jgi:hypothetical protein
MTVRLAESSTPKKESLPSSETLINYQTTRCHIPQDSTLYNHSLENLICKRENKLSPINSISVFTTVLYATHVKF